MQERKLVELFNFTKKIEKKNDKKHVAYKFLSIFMATQVIFAFYNMTRLENYKKEMVEKSEIMFSDFNNMKNAMKSGDQEKSIILFSKIKGQNQGVSDLFLSGQLLSLQSSTESTYKLNPETLHTLNSIYNMEYSKPKQLQITCLVGDFTCYLGRAYIQHQIEPYYKQINKKIMRDNYNMEHIEDYKSWQQKMDKEITKDNYSYDDLSPGERYINRLNNLNLK